MTIHNSIESFVNLGESTHIKRDTSNQTRETRLSYNLKGNIIETNRIGQFFLDRIRVRTGFTKEQNHETLDETTLTWPTNGKVK